MMAPKIPRRTTTPNIDALTDIGASVAIGVSGKKDSSWLRSRPAKKAMKTGEIVGPPRAGQLGMLLAASEHVFTASGRLTTPFPARLDCSSERKTINTLRRIDVWLMENAMIEAEMRSNDFAARMFADARTAPTQSEKDAAECYLFAPQAR